MPRPKKTHEDSRLQVCLLCFGKTRTMRSITTEMQDTISEFFRCGYDPSDLRLPTVVCNTCRLAISEYQKGIFTRTVTLFDISLLGKDPPSRPTRSSPDCSCLLCEISSKPGAPESKVGRPNEVHKPSAIKVCSKCFSVLSRGKSHHCTSGTKCENLKRATAGKPSEQIASAVLKEKVDQASSSSVKLSTSCGGHPMRVDVLSNSLSSPSSSSPLFTAKDISNIQTDLNLSTNQTLQLSSLIRKSAEKRDCIETDLKRKLFHINHTLDRYFSLSMMDFVSEDKGLIRDHVQRPVVHCNDLTGLLNCIVESREYDHSQLICKVGIDGGGGFFKICLSVISEMNDSSHANSSKKDGGVKRLFIIGIVPNIQENYANVLKMWHLVQLLGPNACSSMPSKVFFSCDLKLANILLGLMSHGSNHPCSWCDSHRTSLCQKGRLRTLGSITEKFWKWFETTGQNKSQAKHYGNVVHCPILKGDPNEKVINLLPPPELHLLIGPLNTLFKALEKEWPDALAWAKACHVEREALHGGSFNGNSCHKLLSHVDILRGLCPIQGLKFAETFQLFKDVVSACYGYGLDKNYLRLISKFRESFLALGIPVTPKVHCIFFHITDFCGQKNTGLGMYSEQSFEAVHSDFRSTWARFKVSDENPMYAERLLSAVKDYNSKHL